MTDLEILATAQLVSPSEAARNSDERLTFETIVKITNMAGKKVYFIKWSTGVTLTIVGDPTDKPAWERLILQSYRAAEAGYIGPVTVQEGK